MVNGNKHTKTTALSLFKKYINKGMSRDEEHAFEKKMLNDAFESDALDGLSTISTDELSSSLSQLRNKINIAKPLFRRHQAMLAAASVLLVIGLISVLWLIVPEVPVQISKNETPVVQEKKSQVDSGKANKKDVDTQGDKNLRRRILVNKEELREEKTEVMAAPQLVQDKTNKQLKSVEKITLAKSDDVMTKSLLDTSGAMEHEEEVVAVGYGTLRGESLDGVLNLASTDELRVIQGKVMDKEQRPVAGAKVLLKGTQVATLANVDGYYQMSIPLHDTAKSVVVSHLGFRPQEVEQQHGDSINFVMEEHYYALSEVVTVKVSDKEKRRVNEFIPAEPKGGLEAYIVRIENDLRYPKNGSGKVEQVVVVVTISDTGEIKNIKVKRSPSDAYSVEVIRAIRHDGQWHGATNSGLPQEDKVKLKIRFYPD